MSETIEKETKQAPKVEKKTATKKAAPKAAAKPAAKKAAPKAAEKTVANASEGNLYDIAEGQYDATAETIISALTTLDKQLTDAREIGSDRAKEIVAEFGGENKITELISDLAGYMGQAAGAGMAVGMAPMMVMAGAAKGVYKKITD